MGGYDYGFQGYTASATTGSRTSEIFEPVTLFPNSTVSLEDYFNGGRAPRKILVPVAVATKPCDDDYEHGSSTMAYAAGYDDELQSQTHPVHGTMIPVATRPYGGHEYPKSSPTKPYHAGDGDDDERYRRHRDDELLIEKARVPIPVASRPFGVDEYRRGSPKKANPARDDGKPRQVLPRRTAVPIGTRPNGLEYERSSRPARTDPPRYDIDDKWQGAQNAQTRKPVLWPGWRRPQRSDAYNGSEEEPRASESTNKSGKPIISQEEWSSSPRKGTKLSETLDDINKAAEMFIQNARFAHASKGEQRAPKPSAKNPFPNPTSQSNHGPGSPVDARRRSVAIDCWEAERRYNGQRV